MNELNDKISPLSQWHGKDSLIIAGPCSAETPEQLLSTAQAIKDLDIDYMRAGIWKPRTRPNTFEGKGVEALKWLDEVKSETGLKFATEVASALHVEVALKYNVDFLWIGARSTVSPFVVQEIADALKGTDIPVFVKNPINPDLALWIGALERIATAGVTKIGAIHRGFSTYEKTKFRNPPKWALAIELMRTLPNLPIISDPSHIGGTRDAIAPLSQRAMDFDFDGLIIESHIDPDNAWSDAKQQITPDSLTDLLSNLKFKTDVTPEVSEELDLLRGQINELDREIVEIIAQRMKIVDQVGAYKKANNVKTVQVDRWNEILETRQDWADSFGMKKEFAKDLFELIHTQSVKRQELIIAEDK